MAINDKKPVAVLLAPVLPLPTGCGRALRAWDWLQTLLKDYRVHVLTLDKDIDCTVIPEDYPAEGVWVTANGNLFSARFRRAIGLLFPFLAPWVPRLVVDWPGLQPSDATLCELETCLMRESVKHIVVLRLYMHELALRVSSRFPDATMTLDLDDYESRTRLSVSGALARMRRYREAARECASAIQYYFLERYMLGPYRMAYLAAEADCHRLTTRLADKVAYRPNRLNMPKDFPRAPSGKVLTLLFVGVLNYPPNEEAVRFMVVRLLPELQRKLKRPWQLCIVGRHASDHLSQLMQSSEHIEFIGNAHSLERWYGAAHIVLIPLRAGGGTKFKTLEGFAHRRPIVSTSHGMRGLDALADKHFLLAETAEAFAVAISKLAEDRILADRIAEAGWQLCRKDFRIE
jgi:polysaccharide biosynthesis protein PslH